MSEPLDSFTVIPSVGHPFATMSPEEIRAIDGFGSDDLEDDELDPDDIDDCDDDEDFDRWSNDCSWSDGESKRMSEIAGTPPPNISRYDNI